MFKALSDRKSMSNLTGRIGGKEAGVHELMSGRIAYAKYNPGMMRITEIMNRIVSTSIAEPAFKSHLDNLNGIKNITSDTKIIDVVIIIIDFIDSFEFQHS